MCVCVFLCVRVCVHVCARVCVRVYGCVGVWVCAVSISLSIVLSLTLSHTHSLSLFSLLSLSLLSLFPRARALSLFSLSISPCLSCALSFSPSLRWDYPKLGFWVIAFWWLEIPVLVAVVPFCWVCCIEQRYAQHSAAQAATAAAAEAYKRGEIIYVSLDVDYTCVS